MTLHSNPLIFQEIFFCLGRHTLTVYEKTPGGVFDDLHNEGLDIRVPQINSVTLEVSTVLQLNCYNHEGSIVLCGLKTREAVTLQTILGFRRVGKT